MGSLLRRCQSQSKLLAKSFTFITVRSVIRNMAKYDKKTIQDLEDLGNLIRIHSVESTHASNSGHPTTCSSCADILSVLFFNVMRYKVKAPKDPSNDRLVLSKGHAAPALYGAWAEAGLFPKSDLMNLRKIDCDLEGHPTPRLNFIDVATGSLGQGLSIACGMAYCGKYFDKSSYRVYCILGDGETAEGSVWEAAQFASYYKLDNLCAIFDINRLGQSQETSVGHNMSRYLARLDAFGFNALVVDGHNIVDLLNAFECAAKTKDKPTAIICKTFKGKNYPTIEDTDNWHGKPLGGKSEEVVKYLKTLLKNPDGIKIDIKPPKEDAPQVSITNIKLESPPSYSIGQSVATRNVYGAALVKLSKSNPRVIALDGDMSNSTFSENLKKHDASKYIECFICEQNMVGVAIGLQCRDRCVAFASTFATFLTRSFDQIRMGAISQANINICGSHCGVSIGEDGPSQMGLEDIAMFASIPGSTIFYPGDAVAAERATELAANTKGICFIRTNRPATPVYYKNDEKFEIGKAHILKQSGEDKVLIICAGVTLRESLTAYDALANENIKVRILDPFTVKPIDKEAITKNLKECGNKLLVVEDHYYEGGIGAAVLAVLPTEESIKMKHLAVGEVPRSGPPPELLKKYGIDSTAIVKAVKELA